MSYAFPNLIAFILGLRRFLIRVSGSSLGLGSVSPVKLHKFSLGP